MWFSLYQDERYRRVLWRSGRVGTHQFAYPLWQPDGAHRTKWCGKVYPAQGDLRGHSPYGKYYFFRYRKWKNEKNEDRVCAAVTEFRAKYAHECI